MIHFKLRQLSHIPQEALIPSRQLPPNDFLFPTTLVPIIRPKVSNHQGFHEFSEYENLGN